MVHSARRTRARVGSPPDLRGSRTPSQCRPRARGATAGRPIQSLPSRQHVAPARAWGHPGQESRTGCPRRRVLACVDTIRPMEAKRRPRARGVTLDVHLRRVSARVGAVVAPRRPDDSSAPRAVPGLPLEPVPRLASSRWPTGCGPAPQTRRNPSACHPEGFRHVPNQSGITCRRAARIPSSATTRHRHGYAR